MKKPAPGTLPETLACVEANCNQKQTAPTHCGAPMHIENGKLVCWMGEECGSTGLPSHHNKPMKLIFAKKS